jgi:lipoprotein NlpD
MTGAAGWLGSLAPGLILSSLFLLALGGCASSDTAPVSDRTAATASSSKPAAARPRTPQVAPSTTGRHTVQRGDTLYAIAFANGLDYRDVARWNRIESVDRIFVGQELRLTAPPGAVEIQPLDDDPAPTARPLAEPLLLKTPQAVLLPYSEANWALVNTPPAAVAAKPPVAKAAAETAAKPVSPVSPSAPALAAGDWLWPAEGTLAGRFGAAGGKGINIVGTRNSPVIATASGKVVYSGSGLRGYGKLLIIKHAGEFLSAYAHNESILVKEGDSVTAGQKIAQMGDSDADRVELHFEIRRYGKPLDPLVYLPERS